MILYSISIKSVDFVRTLARSVLGAMALMAVANTRAPVRVAVVVTRCRDVWYATSLLESKVESDQTSVGRGKVSDGKAQTQQTREEEVDDGAREGRSDSH